MGNADPVSAPFGKLLTMEQITWQWCRFTELSVSQLHQIFRLRQLVFVVEQQCAYEDIDGWDDKAVHLLGVDTNESLLACCRVFAPDVRFPEANIGRILTSSTARGQGLGHELVRQSKAFCAEHFPGVPIRIAGQAHLTAFYGTHGFLPEGDEYPVDGIPHVDMFLRSAK